MRCSVREIDLGPRHDWQKRAYESPGDCVTSERCRRCGERQAVAVEHERFVPADSVVPVRPRRSLPCVVVQSCVRCGSTEVDEGRHVWGRRFEVGGSEVRSCERCGAEDELLPPAVACLDCDGTGLLPCPGCDERGLCTVPDLIDGADDVTRYRERSVPCALGPGRARGRWVGRCRTCGGTGTTSIR